MCKTKMAVDAAQPDSLRTRPTHSPSSTTRPTHSSSQTTHPTQPSPRTPSTQRQSPFATATTIASTSSAGASGPSTSGTSSSSRLSSRTSLSSLRDSLSQNPHIYDISEIRAATNNFLAKRYSSSSSTPSWRCTLRGADAIVFQRKFRRKMELSDLKQQLAIICRSHHNSVVKLLGASISGDHIYLVYDFIKGANLSDCLRNKNNPNFSVLASWLTRMQIATDLASALDYIHNKTGLDILLVHNHIKSSSIVVVEPAFSAKLSHFGAAQLSGEITGEVLGEIAPEELTRSDSGAMEFSGVRGYMSPEFQATGAGTQKSDVYAFGVVILELLSGEEPLKYRFDKRRHDFVRTSVVETARAAVDGGDDGGGGGVRRWIDGKLKDSFPVDVAEKMMRLALECVHVDADKRPDMGHVAGKISRMYLKSKKWDETMKFSDQISVSLAPR